MTELRKLAQRPCSWAGRIWWQPSFRRRALKWLKLANPAAQSPAETVARLRIHEAGLRPETGVVLRVPGGRRRYPDFYFRSGLTHGRAVTWRATAHVAPTDRAAHRR